MFDKGATSPDGGPSERSGLMKGGMGGGGKKSGYSRLDGDNEGLLEDNEPGGDDWSPWSKPAAKPQSPDYSYSAAAPQSPDYSYSRY